MSKHFFILPNTFIIVYLTMNVFAYAHGGYGFEKNPQLQQLKQTMEQDMQQIKVDKEKLKRDMRKLQKDREEIYKLKRQLMNEHYRQQKIHIDTTTNSNSNKKLQQNKNQQPLQ